ncbi:I78 family peptidase inhibitor [Pararhodobacter sp.]|uniref:I78 family peptidase inhibitor n=1 Tax=Pararhodobacter sp. TaxID=2127056 RepID=UPI002FDED7C5
MPEPAPSPYPVVRPVPQPAPHPTNPRPLPPRPVQPEREGCDASRYQHMVGGPLPDPFPRRGTVRVYRSDMSVTMEYDPNRLNVEIDPATRRIVTIHCG